MTKKKRIIVISLISFFSLIIAVFVFAIVSPWPTIWLTRHFFSKDAYDNVVTRNSVNGLNVTISEDHIYDLDAKKHTNSNFNIIFPNSSDELPVLIYVHGGAFVASDKNDTQNYLAKIANHGFIVINMNYGLAPRSNFPMPLIQLCKMYNYLIGNEHFIEEKYDINLDMQSVFLGGDSAGANIVSIFSLIQTNSTFLNQTTILKSHKDALVIPNAQINGIILLCGVFDFNSFKSFKGLPEFLVNQLGRSITGQWKWKNSASVDEMSLYKISDSATYIHYMTSSFPKTYITDGSDTMSFNSQGEILKDLLIAEGVYVKSRFFPDLRHIFHFMLENVEADNTLSLNDKEQIDKCVNGANLVFAEIIEFMNTFK